MAEITTTTTITEPTKTETPTEKVVTIRLKPRRKVKWTEDVVDNEGMGKKKSKKCCIYHKPKEFGESDSESDSDSDCDHDHDHHHDHDHTHKSH